MKSYIKFEPSVQALCDETEDDLYFIYKSEDMVVKEIDDKWIIPTYKDIEKENLRLVNKQCMGTYKGVNCYSLEILGGLETDSLIFIGLMEYTRKMDEEDFLLASRGKLLLDFKRRNQFCGVCGSKMYPKDSIYERSMICKSCCSPTWPRTSPAILVSITRGDEILLVNSHIAPKEKYSVVAGFVEYGETFEEAVEREVFEEVGIEIEDIEYFGSKPWPFPNSMMIAYKAKYKSGEIKIDKNEINDANWYRVDDMPDLFENKNSIACDLIEEYINKNK